jgi:iron uptake system component EfeO
MNPRATSARAHLVAPVASVALALAVCACGGSVAARHDAAPAVGPEAGVTSRYGTDTGDSDRATSLAAEDATRTYANQVGTWTSDFVGSIGALQADVAGGHTAAAESDELAAQADYDSFRDLDNSSDGSINASSLDELETDVVPGETFGGLHAVERDLWSGGPAAADVAGLTAQAPVAEFVLSRLRLGPEAVGTVAVDQLTWVVDTALTTSQEPVSHLGLVDVDATEAAAARAFAAVEPLAQLVDPSLTRTVAGQFATLATHLVALGAPATTPDTSVTAAARLALSQQLDATASTLARLTARLAPYGTQGSPS